MSKKSIMAIAAAITFGLPPVAAANTLLFDPTGNSGQNPNNVVEFDAFSWSHGNALAQGVAASGAPQPGTRFTLYSHASLGTFDLGGTMLNDQKGLNQTFEMTFVLSTGLVVQSVGRNSIQFGFSADAPNFFEIYVDSDPATRSHAATGSGYNDGTLVLQATINREQGIIGSFLASTASPVALDNFNNLDTTHPLAGSVPQPNSYPGVLTVRSGGFVDLRATSNFIDHRFFFGTSPNGDEKFQLGLDFNTPQITPFGQQDPSECFTGTAVANAQQGAQGVVQCDRIFNQGLVNGTGGAIVAAGGVGVNANVGSINGINGMSGPDFIFQIEADTFNPRVIPAPATLTLFGLGLGFFGLARRKPQRRA